MARPVTLLLTIVGLCVVTMAGVVLLAMTGHHDDVVILLGFMGPIVTALIALKAHMVRTNLNDVLKRIDRGVNGERSPTAPESHTEGSHDEA